MFSFVSEIYFGLELLEQSRHQLLTWANDEWQYNTREQELQAAGYRPRQQVTSTDV